MLFRSAVGGFFILRFSRRILCLAAMLARSSAVGGLSSEALAKEDVMAAVGLLDGGLFNGK